MDISDDIVLTEMSKFINNGTIKESIFEYMDHNYTSKDRISYRLIVDQLFSNHHTPLFVQDMKGNEIMQINGHNNYRIEIHEKGIDLIPDNLSIGVFTRLLRFDNYQTYLREKAIDSLL